MPKFKKDEICWTVVPPGRCGIMVHAYKCKYPDKMNTLTFVPQRIKTFLMSQPSGP